MAKAAKLLPCRSAVIIRAAADIDDAEIAAWRPVADGALTCPLQIPVQVSVLSVIAVTERGVQFQTVILFAHGVVRAGDNIEPGHGRVDLLRHPAERKPPPISAGA